MYSVNFPPLAGGIYPNTADVEVNTTRRNVMDCDDSVSQVHDGLPLSDELSLSGGNTGLESVTVSTNPSVHSFVSRQNDHGDNLGLSSAGSCN